MSIWRKAILILIVPVFPAILSGFLNWNEMRSGLKAENEITIEEALRIEDAVWVDAREWKSYDQDHIPGAIHLSEAEWSTGVPVLLTTWRPGSTIIVYCDGKDCSSSRRIADRIRSGLGLPQVFVLRKGWEAWTAR